MMAAYLFGNYFTNTINIITFVNIVMNQNQPRGAQDSLRVPLIESYQDNGHTDDIELHENNGPP